MKRKGQEEMIGFALILILVGIIILVFVSISLGKSNNQSQKTVETESFVQTMLQYTSVCQNSFGNLSVNDLIFACNSNNNCANGENSCQVLNKTLKDMMNKTWDAGPENPVKGYQLNITSRTKYITALQAGNITASSQGGSQDFSKAGIGTSPASVTILMKIYS